MMGDRIIEQSDEFQVPSLKFKEPGKKLRALIGFDGTGSHAKVAKAAKEWKL